jgi:hypothetical protein
VEDFEIEVQALYGLAGTRLPFRRSPDVKALFRPVSDAIEEYRQWAAWWTDNDDVSPQCRADAEHRADEALGAVRALIEGLYSVILGAFHAAVVFAHLLAVAMAQPEVKPTSTRQADRPPLIQLLPASPASPNAPPASTVHVLREALAA